MRAAAVSLCASLRPSVFNTAILTAGEKKKKKDKKEKKLLSPPISACADLTACCKIPSLSKETACSSIHYLETQREQASKDAFSVLMC